MALTIDTKVISSWYLPDSQKDEDKPAKFKLRPLVGETHMAVFAETDQDRNGELKLTGIGLKAAIHEGVVGWENISDANGKPLKFTKFNLRHLPMEILSDLAAEIVNRSSATEEEEKN
jgi:hypothetical protein